MGHIKKLGQSNEIIAISKLLEELTIKDCVVTTDATGCQKKIAEKIIEKEADYILQVKDNQKGLKEEIIKLFEQKSDKSTDINSDIGHGRIETRKCEVISNLALLKGKNEWENLNSIFRRESRREIKKLEKPPMNIDIISAH